MSEYVASTSADSLFKRILGANFDRLPPILQQIHAVQASQTFSGRCDITGGATWASRFLARAAALPPPGRNVPVEVTIESSPDCEQWRRSFNGRRMHTRLTEREGRLVERLGAVQLTFVLEVVENRIVWSVVEARAMGVRLPTSWFGNVMATEAVDAGRYHFDVRAGLPYIGLLIHYRGWLKNA